MAAQRPLGSDQRYILSMTNPEWITGAPSDARSIRAIQSLERRGLVQCRSGRWYITPAGREHLEQLEAQGLTVPTPVDCSVRFSVGWVYADWWLSKLGSSDVDSPDGWHAEKHEGWRDRLALAKPVELQQN